MKATLTISDDGMYQLTIIAENDVETIALRAWDEKTVSQPIGAVLLIKFSEDKETAKWQK